MLRFEGGKWAALSTGASSSTTFNVCVVTDVCVCVCVCGGGVHFVVWWFVIGVMGVRGVRARLYRLDR